MTVARAGEGDEAVGRPVVKDAAAHARRGSVDAGAGPVGLQARAAGSHRAGGLDAQARQRVCSLRSSRGVLGEEVDELPPVVHVDSAARDLAPADVGHALARDAAPQARRMVEARDEGSLGGALRAAGPFEGDAELLEPCDGRSYARDEGGDERRVRHALTDRFDGPGEVRLIVRISGAHEAEAPGARVEAGPAEEGALAGEADAGARPGGLERGGDPGDAGADDEDVVGLEGRDGCHAGPFNGAGCAGTDLGRGAKGPLARKGLGQKGSAKKTPPRGFPCGGAVFRDRPGASRQAQDGRVPELQRRVLTR